MRYVVTVALTLLCIQPAIADKSQFDRDLVLSAGRSYVESYLRWHSFSHPPQLNWSKPIVEFVPFEEADFHGYVAVYFPEAGGVGAGHAYFQVGKVDPGYLILVAWGYTDRLEEEKARFEKGAGTGLLPKARQ
jgi:hypothetical protein